MTNKGMLNRLYKKKYNKVLNNRSFRGKIDYIRKAIEKVFIILKMKQKLKNK